MFSAFDRRHLRPVIVTVIGLEFLQPGQRRPIRLVILEPIRRSIQPGAMPDEQAQFFVEPLVKFDQSPIYRATWSAMKPMVMSA